MILISHKRQKGFTLLEVMIAVAITALIGVASTQLLSNVVNSKQVTEVRSEKLASLQQFNQVLSYDIQQIINRGYRDVYGNVGPSLQIDGPEYLAEWSRLGWGNSVFSSDPRATIQRVAYQLHSLESEECEEAKAQLELWGEFEANDDCLVRYSWNVLDRAPDSEPLKQMILEQVVAIEIELLTNSVPSNNAQGSTASEPEWHTYWPDLNAGAQNSGGKTTPDKVPSAMKWKIELPRLGEIERLWAFAYDDQ